ncbi:MAG: AAA domain-containing protein [Planktomarina sp.]|nr:AAA domain-containing protein [Planktomarina sp.]
MPEQGQSQQVRDNLLGLLNYAREVHEIRGKVVSDYLKKPAVAFALSSNDLLDHDNVSISSGLDENWVTIGRVERTNAPDCPELCAPFLSVKELNNPEREPVMSSHGHLICSIDAASDLVEAHLALKENITGITGNSHEVKIMVSISDWTHLTSVFNNWLVKCWRPWAEFELTILKQIQLYKFFFEVRHALLHRSDEVELVLAQNFVFYKSEDDFIVRAPLIEHVVDMSLDENNSYSLLITPKEDSARIVTEPCSAAMLPGAGQIRQKLQEVLRLHEQNETSLDAPFDQHLSDSVGMSVATFLHPESKYDSEISSCPHLPQVPIVSSIWMLALKPKSTQPYLDNIDNFIAQIDSTQLNANLSNVAIAFGSQPNDERVDEGEVHLDLNAQDLSDFGRDSSTQWAGSTASAIESGGSPENNIPYFFPLPFNSEQKSILDLLDKSDAVAVQGPPGTGKSHTIANIVAHYMATGRRVLISAKTPAALAGVRSKLPETLSKLTISILDTDGAGKKQVEEAISFISSRVQSLNINDAKKQIGEIENEISAKKDRIAVIENSLFKHAEYQLTKVQHKDDFFTPAELVKQIKDEPERDHSWFPDELQLTTDYAPKFSDEDIRELFELRKSLGEYIIYVGQLLPLPSALPDIPTVKQLHESLQQSQKIEASFLRGQLPEPAGAIKQFDKKINTVRDVFNQIHRVRPHTKTELDWGSLIKNQFGQGVLESDRQQITNLLTDIGDWFSSIEKLMIYSINIDVIDWRNKDVVRAVSNASSGQKPFGVGDIFKGVAKKSFEKIEIQGKKPSNVDEWKIILQFFILASNLQPMIARWTSLSVYIGFPKLPAGLTDLILFLRDNKPILQSVHVSYIEWSDALAVVKELYPWGINHNKVDELAGEFDLLLDSMNQWYERGKLEDARSLSRSLSDLARTGHGPIFHQLRDLSACLGLDDDVEKIGDSWRLILSELGSLNETMPNMVRLEQLADKVEASRAPKWAKLLKSDPNTDENEKWAKYDWRFSWDYWRAMGFITNLPSRNKISELVDEQSDLEVELSRVYNRLIELRALLGLRQNMTNSISSNLARFSAAFQRIGINITGVRSKGHYKEARDAMKGCYGAIPCWIIPEGRVAEQIPAELGAFDLVIIDEASQSDVTSIPVILRGKKLLVVGDDKQVSPSLAGIKEEKINQLMESWLSDHPLHRIFHPSNSLYDLVGVMSPGKKIMLQEHFRCVEAIINFCSKQFYSEPLIPLRIPTALERLTPPLIDIWVKDGQRHLDTNDREAEVIVEEIEAITNNEKYRNRSIGVISLIGHKQAAKISKMLFDRLGVETIKKYSIDCGDARFFQGQEKDIVFLSMVASPGAARAHTTLDARQRFNVAVSRARDRLVLVRSVGKEDLTGVGDLKAALLDHFERPVDVTDQDKQLIDLCESGFERQVFQRLVAEGYRVIPQYSVGGYRIDLVVEGAGDRRIAIELDGDQYHGPNNYARDQIRQKRLERVGWKFWRCWASDWYLDSDACYNDLVVSLGVHSIEPIGSSYFPASFVRHEERGERQSTESLLSDLENDEIESLNENLVEDDEIVTDERPQDAVHTNLEGGLDLEDSLIVEAGDGVTISYSHSPNELHTWYLTAGQSDVNLQILGPSAPLVEAILGMMVDEEFEVITSEVKTGRIINIEKGGLYHRAS